MHMRNWQITPSPSKRKVCTTEKEKSCSNLSFTWNSQLGRAMNGCITCNSCFYLYSSSHNWFISYFNWVQTLNVHMEKKVGFQLLSSYSSNLETSFQWIALKEEINETRFISTLSSGKRVEVRIYSFLKSNLFSLLLYFIFSPNIYWPFKSFLLVMRLLRLF